MDDIFRTPLLESLKDCTDEEVMDVVHSGCDWFKLKLEKESDDVKERELCVSSDSDSLAADKDNIKQKNSSKTPDFNDKWCLELTFQEAYFLSSGLKCLIVKDRDQKLSLESLWTKFCEFTPAENFPVAYTAYHHFRSRGWIVRPGLKFIFDYALYESKSSMKASNQAAYSVIIRALKEEDFQYISFDNSQIPWRLLFAQSRFSISAGKELILLNVAEPANMSEDILLTQSCVSQYQLMGVLYQFVKDGTPGCIGTAHPSG